MLRYNHSVEPIFKAADFLNKVTINFVLLSVQKRSMSSLGKIFFFKEKYEACN